MHVCTWQWGGVHSSSLPSQALRTELEATRRRVAELEAHATTPRTHRVGGALAPARSGALTNKKNEDADADYDIEAAMLTGGGSGFVPMAGVMRGAVFPLCKGPFVGIAHQLDRGAIMLNQRVGLRAAVMLYVLLLHVLAIL